MSNKTQTNATARPWIHATAGLNMTKNYSQPYAIAEAGYANLIAGVFGDVKGGEEAAKANAALIVRAVNEYDALCKVAETAEEFWNEPRVSRDGDKLEKALAELTAIRGGAK